MSQTESGVAEQMVGMSIRAMESLSRLLASGAKNLAVFLFSVAKGTKQYRGITSIKQLLDGGHELVTLELNKNELREFCLHAKKNDIPCTVIHDKKLYQDTVPVLVRKTDAERVNRVVDKMRLQHLPEDRAAAREQTNPTTGRTNTRSQPRSRTRPSERAFGGRGSTGSISRSDLRPSVRAKIHNIQRERRAAQPPRIVPPPTQPPAWNPRDDVMMEAMRQFLVALTTLTQEVTKQPVQEKQALIPQRMAQQRQTVRETASEQSRARRGASFRSQQSEGRESTRAKMERARQSHSQSRTPAQPTKNQSIKPRGGRGGR